MNQLDITLLDRETAQTLRRELSRQLSHVDSMRGRERNGVRPASDTPELRRKSNDLLDTIAELDRANDFTLKA